MMSTLTFALFAINSIQAITALDMQSKITSSSNLFKAYAIAFALIVNVVVSLLTKKPSKEILDEFDSIKTIEI